MSLTDFSAPALFAMILILTGLSAFFSGSETAMIGLNRYRLRHLVKEKHRGARKANRLLRRPDRLLGVILIGNNLMNFTAASLATIIGLRLFGNTGVILAPIVLTVFFLIFAEVAPKTIAARAPERLAFPAVYVLEPLLKFLYPGVLFINAISNFLVRPFLPSTSVEANDNLSVDELRTVVHEGGVGIPDQGQNMLLGILDLEKVSVNDIMVPRNEIVGINIIEDMSEILQIMANSQHTRLPVYKDNVNNTLGMLHLRRVARYLPKKEREEDLTKADIMQLTSEPYYVPEGTPLPTQLFNFKKEKRRIALVVDEYGEIQGIVTLEDILEEIVGEFTTDFASKMPEIHPQDDGTYYIDGMAQLRDINRALGWDLPTHGPKTLNGLVLEHLEMIPESNLCLKIDDYLIETLQIKDNIIKNIRITQQPRANPPSDD
jgi:Mg2+/Co2+ transporter CorB